MHVIVSDDPSDAVDGVDSFLGAVVATGGASSVLAHKDSDGHLDIFLDCPIGTTVPYEISPKSP